jgi:hypothetical protein
VLPSRSSNTRNLRIRKLDLLDTAVDPCSHVRWIPGRAIGEPLSPDREGTDDHHSRFTAHELAR